MSWKSGVWFRRCPDNPECRKGEKSPKSEGFSLWGPGVFHSAAPSWLRYLALNQSVPWTLGNSALHFSAMSNQQHANSPSKSFKRESFTDCRASWSQKWGVIISPRHFLKFHSVASILVNLRWRLAAGGLAGLSKPYFMACKAII